MQIQTGRYGALLQRLLGITDKNPSSHIAPEIQPVLVLESERPEWNFISGVREAKCAALFAAPGASNFSQILFTNPAGSNTIAVLDYVKLGASLGGSSTYDWIGAQVLTPNTSPNVGTFACITTDTRDPANIANSALQTACRVEGHIDTSLPTSRATTRSRCFQGASGSSAYWTPEKLEPRHVMTPGTQYVVSFATARNVEIGFEVGWRERALQITEQAP